MPYFEKEAEFEIDPEEYLDQCSGDDIKELVSILKDTYPEYLDANYYNSFSVGEQEFENTLNALHGKWNSLTTEEEQLVRSVAKRFL